MLSSFKGCVILFGSLHVAKSHKRSSMEGRCSDLVQDAPANYFISGEACSVACMWSKKFMAPLGRKELGDLLQETFCMLYLFKGCLFLIGCSYVEGRAGR
jgi:hypothetical protein